MIKVLGAEEDEDDGYPEAMVAKAWCISAQNERFYLDVCLILNAIFNPMKNKHNTGADG